MLLQNKPPQLSSRSKTQSIQSVTRKQKGLKKKKRVINSSNVKNPTRVTVTSKKQKPQPLPWWLQTLLFTKNISSVFCLFSVTVALVMYGMTVYAPKFWTQKYQELKDLQKKERQFTFNDETMKNQLANIANEPTSGLINPDPNNPAIFLPQTEVKAVKSVTKKQTAIKNIERIYPIAY